MTQQALIRGEVTFRAGDGPLMPIPPGPVEIDQAADAVMLAWGDDQGNASSTAITREEFDRFVREGKIRVLQG